MITYTVYFTDKPEPAVISASQFIYSEQDGYIFLDDNNNEIARYKKENVVAFTEGIPFWQGAEASYRAKDPVLAV